LRDSKIGLQTTSDLPATIIFVLCPPTELPKELLLERDVGGVLGRAISLNSQHHLI